MTAALRLLEMLVPLDSVIEIEKDRLHLCSQLHIKIEKINRKQRRKKANANAQQSFR